VEGRSRQEDARTARDRALRSILLTDDFGTQRALWKTALKFHADVRAGDRLDEGPACALSW
jgi:hypothetical protein